VGKKKRPYGGNDQEWARAIRIRAHTHKVFAGNVSSGVKAKRSKNFSSKDDAPWTIVRVTTTRGKK